MGKLEGKEKLYVECLSELLNVVNLDKIGRLKLLGTLIVRDLPRPR